jgi:O-antigen/teichoic acid export membrane protein
VLVGGTALSQALMMLVLPFLTRLYTPQDFSVLAVYTGLLVIIAPAACLRLDIAIPMPARDEDAANLLALALVFAVIISSALAVPALLIPRDLAYMLRAPKLEPFLWMLPIGVLLAASSSAFQFWFVRSRDFSLIARTRITQAVGAAGVMVGFGWLGLTPGGLIVGQAVNSGAAAFGLGRHAFVGGKEAVKSVSMAEMRRVLRVYDRFPKYSTLETLANNASIQLPVVMIAAMASGPEAGFLALAMRVMQGPMGLIGNAISQVYVANAPDAFRAGDLGAFTANILGALMRTGVGPLLFTGMVAPDVFAMVFGDDWRRAGILVAWMMPWFIIQFLTSPVSMALHVTNSQKLALGLQFVGLIIRVLVIIAAENIAPNRLSEAYAISGVIFYSFYFICVLFVVAVKTHDLSVQLKKSFPYLVAWLMAGGLCMYLLRCAVRAGF